MPRTFTENFADDSNVVSLLNRLIDKNTESKEYGNTMFELGYILGRLISLKVDETFPKITLACTVEDADYLARGIIDCLEKDGKEVLLTVFWNKRFTTDLENNLTVAPIIKEFHESGYQDSHLLVIIKSIISSSCIVRTNLTKLINEFEPTRIMVAAPVLLKGATTNLENEFDPNISKRFEYIYFATDDQKTAEGWVDPGIGGDVYQRLGLSNEEAKNKFIPLIVKERRVRYSHK